MKDLPFSAYSVGLRWAKDNGSVLRRFLIGYQKSVDWFYEDKNRNEAIKIVADLSGGQTVPVTKSYEFFRKIEFFERTGRVSKPSLATLSGALKDLGVVDGLVNVDALVLPDQ